jgi:hypothetical protein
MWAYLEITGLTILIKIASSTERQNRTIRRSYGADSLLDLSAPRALDAGDKISGSKEVVKDWVLDVKARDPSEEVAGCVKVAKELDCVVPEVVD